MSGFVQIFGFPDCEPEPSAMAISQWAAKTKKQLEDGGAEATTSRTKVLCSQHERSLKKMEGDLSLVKDCKQFSMDQNAES